MPGGGGAAVGIPGVLGQKVHVVENDTVEVVNLASLDKSDVHQYPAVKCFRPCLLKGRRM